MKLVIEKKQKQGPEELNHQPDARLQHPTPLRFPSWNSWDLLRCSAVKPGSRWMSLRLGGGGVPGAFPLFLRLMGGVPGGVMVFTTRGCFWRGDGGSERWPKSRGGKSPAAGASTVSRSAYRGGGGAPGLRHVCCWYLDWTMGLWDSWYRIHWLASGWPTGVFSLPDSEVGHWMDQSCSLAWLPGGERENYTTPSRLNANAPIAVEVNSCVSGRITATALFVEGSLRNLYRFFEELLINQ
ncbi:hypothetical protein EYF80_044411 [Liparis tanakae]|uniref:Uncharacterized protein n=1 Tax=Liparis tanakae TaxID=230148 RepID=A0A4Z2FWU8_9TELE|nr:hypothetical protein EYF80_044411 [Liparis tanakae]